MKSIGLPVLLILLVLSEGCSLSLSPGAGDAYHLHQQSRYGELEAHMVPRIPDLTTAPTEDLFYLCEAYAEVKKYYRLFPCLEQLAHNVQQGDRFLTNLWIETANDVSFYIPFARARAYLELGQYPQAIEEAQTANHLTKTTSVGYLIGRAPLWEVRTMGLITLAHIHAGHHDAAAAWVDRLENYSIPLVGFGMTEPVYQSEMAKTYLALGQFDKAYAIVSQGRSTLTKAAVGIGSIIFNVEDVLIWVEIPRRFMHYKSAYETGHVQEAKTGYDTLLQQPGIASNGEIYWLILFDRGKIAEGEGQLTEAIEFYQRAIEVIERQRATIHTEASKIGFVGDKQAVYHLLIRSLIKQGHKAQAFEYVERAKARALVDLLAAQKDFSATEESEMEVRRLVNSLDTLESEARVQTNRPASSPSQGSGPRGIHVVQAEQAAVQKKLATLAPELASLITVTDVASGDIGLQLQAEETLLEYYYHGDTLYAFVVTAQGVEVVQLDGEKLEKTIGQFRAALLDRRSQSYRPLAEDLYAKLVAPVASWLTTSKLLIVPHGILHYLPFATLRDGQEDMLDRYSLRYLPSASVLQFLNKSGEGSAARLLALGNPDLGDLAADLPYAQEEVLKVAEPLVGAKVLVRKEATETAVKQLGGQYTHLHFAVHGKFDAAAPLTSGLMLAKDDENDGLLSVGELYNLRLQATLVTLSACETGLGLLNTGDDVVGLVRGFLYAGSQSIVASLWQVDDLATARLMVAFYRHLPTMSKAEALRQAQLATREQYNHPYYWAPFQLTGQL